VLIDIVENHFHPLPIWTGAAIFAWLVRATLLAHTNEPENDSPQEVTGVEDAYAPHFKFGRDLVLVRTLRAWAPCSSL
jgi:hypothetical protein